MITLNNRKLCENCFAETTMEPCPHCGFNKNAYRHDPITLAVGSVLNQRYMIGGVIGKGGFGITYLAYDLKLDARLAVKEYYPMGLAIRNPGSTIVSVSNEESEDSFRTGAEKFYNEAKMVARFNGNPNIVSVHDFFYENDTVYFTMGYLQGQTLKSYLKHKKITEGQAITIFQAMSSALMASHSLNILHRDISPDNIMLCDDGSIRLLDFGAARQVMAEQSQSLSVILKQGFAPLEQYQKKGKQGPWTDVYALGATVYTALTGDMLNDPMTRLEDDSEFSANKHGISEALWSIIQKCTQLKIQDRYQDIFELKKDLNSIGIESEPFTDIKEEITDILRGKTAKSFGNSMGTGSANPNETVLLGAGGGNGRTMSMDGNATVFLGAQGEGTSNETVAMSPQEAAAYTAGKNMQTGQQNPQTTGQQQMGWGTTTNMPQQPVTGGYTGQPATGGPYTGQPATGGPYTGQPAPGPNPNGMYQQGQQQMANGKKGLPLPLIIVICLAAIALLAFIGFAVLGRMIKKGPEDNTVEITEATTEDTSGDAGDEAKALRSAGVKDISKYSDDTYEYSICYPAEYNVSDADEKTVEIADKEGSVHVAVRFMDRYIDDTILYDAQDFSDMVNVRRDNLLPVEGSGSTPDTDDAGRIDIAGQEDVPHFEYHYEDKKDKRWDGNVYIFDSKGQYGCYVVYTLVYHKADDYDELQEYAKACADSFRVDGKYDPEEVEIFSFDDMGVKTSVTDGIEATVEDDGDDIIHVNYKLNGKSRWSFMLPGELYGTEYSDMIIGACNSFSQYNMSTASDMIPIDFGHYKGYYVKTDLESDGEADEGRIYVFSTNAGSDAKYQSFIVVGSADDDERLKELVGGFRFEGAAAFDNTGVDTGETVSMSEGSSGGDDVDDFLDDYSTEINKSEYIFPGTESREVTNQDVEEFLQGYLDSNNAKNMSENEKRRLCARALCYARNEIYARHGYIFNSSELRDLFNSMSWYEGTTPSDRFNSNVFNAAEKRNVEFLKSKMEDYGGYQPAK